MTVGGFFSFFLSEEEEEEEAGEEDDDDDVLLLDEAWVMTDARRPLVTPTPTTRTAAFASNARRRSWSARRLSGDDKHEELEHTPGDANTNSVMASSGRRQRQVDRHTL